MNKIQIRALSLLLIAMPYACSALGKSAHGDSTVRTFTTAEIQNRNRSGSAQTIGTQFVATDVSQAHVLFSPASQLQWFCGAHTIFTSYGIMDIISYNKFTGEPDGIINTDIATFMGGDDIAIGDTRCTFDRWGQRFIVLTSWIALIVNTKPLLLLRGVMGQLLLRKQNGRCVLFAPTEIAIPETPASFPDSPSIGTDQNAVYVNIDILTI